MEQRTLMHFVRAESPGVEYFYIALRVGDAAIQHVTKLPLANEPLPLKWCSRSMQMPRLSERALPLHFAVYRHPQAH